MEFIQTAVFHIYRHGRCLQRKGAGSTQFFAGQGDGFIRRYDQIGTGPHFLRVYGTVFTGHGNNFNCGIGTDVYVDFLRTRYRVSEAEEIPHAGKTESALEDCSLNEFHLTADTTQSMLDRFYCTDLYADLGTGTLEVHIPANANNYRYEITGSQAVCHLNGETIPLPYQPEVTDSTPTGEIVITAGNANVDLTISE